MYGESCSSDCRSCRPGCFGCANSAADNWESAGTGTAGPEGPWTPNKLFKNKYGFSTRIYFTGSYTKVSNSRYHEHVTCQAGLV